MLHSLRRVAPAVALMTLAGSAFAQVGGTPVAVSGQPAGSALSSGSANGTNGLAFSANSFSANGRSSVINQNGDVVFTGAFAGGVGAWRNMAGSNANTNLARGGTALPAHSAPAGNYSNTLAWASPLIDSSGNAMFYNAMAGTTGPLGSISDAGVFRANAAGAVNFATRGINTGTTFDQVGNGAPLPTDRTGTPVTQLQVNTNQAMALMNSNGQMFLTGSWRTTGGAVSGTGGFVGTANAGAYDTLTPAFLRGDTVSGLGFTDIQGDFLGGISFNDNARFAATMDFISGTGSPVPVSAQNRGLATNRNGTLEVLMIRSTTAPWLAAGVNVGAIGALTPSMNNAGQIAQSFSLEGAGITAANDNVLGLFQADGSVALLHEGTNTDRQTAGGATVRLGGNFAGFAMSASGSVFASSSGNSDSAGNSLPAGGGNISLFRWSPSSGVTTIALTGDTAPGTGGGQFTSFSTSARAVNGNDQIAFLANLVTTAGNPGGVTSSNDLCLYATDVNGNLILIAREGSALPGDPVAGRTVTSILFNTGIGNAATNGQDGRGTFFNDLGQLVFNVGFSDGGSGVFVANVAPTPGAAAVIGLGALAAVRRRRQA